MKCVETAVKRWKEKKKCKIKQTNKQTDIWFAILRNS